MISSPTFFHCFRVLFLSLSTCVCLSRCVCGIWKPTLTQTIRFCTCGSTSTCRGRRARPSTPEKSPPRTASEGVLYFFGLMRLADVDALRTTRPSHQHASLSLSFLLLLLHKRTGIVRSRPREPIAHSLINCCCSWWLISSRLHN